MLTRMAPLLTRIARMARLLTRMACMLTRMTRWLAYYTHSCGHLALIVTFYNCICFLCIFLPFLVWAFPGILIFKNPYIYFLALKSQQRNYRRAIPQLLVLRVAGDSKEESISGRLMSPTKEAAVNKFSPLSVYFDSNHQSVNQQCTTKIWARSYK